MRVLKQEMPRISRNTVNLRSEWLERGYAIPPIKQTSKQAHFALRPRGSEEHRRTVRPAQSVQAYSSAGRSVILRRRNTTSIQNLQVPRYATTIFRSPILQIVVLRSQKALCTFVKQQTISSTLNNPQTSNRTWRSISSIVRTKVRVSGGYQECCSTVVSTMSTAHAGSSSLGNSIFMLNKTRVLLFISLVITSVSLLIIHHRTED
jgi:hypothetical protein